MSSRRSRKGGMWISMVLRRKSKSSRNWPATDGSLKIGVGGGDHAHIDFSRARRSQSLDFAGFQDAQQFGLLTNRNVADFIKENRATVGQLEAAHAVRSSICKCSLDVAEKLAFEDPFAKAPVFTATSGREER